MNLGFIVMISIILCQS